MITIRDLTPEEIDKFFEDNKQKELQAGQAWCASMSQSFAQNGDKENALMMEELSHWCNELLQLRAIASARGGLTPCNVAVQNVFDSLLNVGEQLMNNKDKLIAYCIDKFHFNGNTPMVDIVRDSYFQGVWDLACCVGGEDFKEFWRNKSNSEKE